MIFSVFVAAAAQQPSAINPNLINDANRQVVQAYWKCTTDKALTLIPSGEPAETIATVAVNSCEGLISVAADAANVEWHRVTPGLSDYEARSGQPVPGARDDILKLLRSYAHDSALKAVVEAKARAQTR